MSGLRDTYQELANRVEDVTELYGEYASLHEAFSVLLEEVGELGQEIYARERNIGRIRAEAMDVAVVACRLLKEWPLCRGEIDAVRVSVIAPKRNSLMDKLMEKGEVVLGAVLPGETAEEAMKRETVWL